MNEREDKRTLSDVLKEINELALALVEQQVNFMQEKQRRADAIVFFCNNGKFPDEG
jgi:hypothetical protein